MGDYRPVPRWPGVEEARHLGEALDDLAHRLRDTIGALRESREEYLALVEQLPGAVYRCADREGWPLDYISPRIEQLTGYRAEALLAGDAQGFTRLILPEDAAALAPVLSESIRQQGRYELRYRIRHRDGRLRWIWELGSAHPAIDGGAASLTGVLFDITERETAQQAMGLLRGGVEARVGGDFFLALATGLARVLDIDTVMIGRFRGAPPTRLASLALAHREGPGERAEFDIAGTPSAAVLAEGLLEVHDDVVGRFPADTDLTKHGLRAYIGRRLDDSHGRPIGVLAVLHGEAMPADGTAARLLDLFQPRVAAELERVIAGGPAAARRHPREPGGRAHARARGGERVAVAGHGATGATREAGLLGNLVAGVAHELNTPIGNALTVSTALNDIHRQFAGLAEGTLRRSALDRFVNENHEATALIERNLRAPRA